MTVDAPPEKICNTCDEAKPKTEFWRGHGRCKPCYRAAERRRYKETDGIKHVRRANWARYGLSVEAYHEMFVEQGGVCKICETPPPSDRALAIDHCHDTGVVRGLLCTGCNVALGAIHEKPDVLRRCADYLDAYNRARQ